MGFMKQLYFIARPRAAICRTQLEPPQTSLPIRQDFRWAKNVGRWARSHDFVKANLLCVLTRQVAKLLLPDRSQAL